MWILRTIGKRVVAAVPILLFLTAVVFLLDKLSGVNPARVTLGANAPPSAVASLEHKLWLDRPLPAQYLHYLDRAFIHADLGRSPRTQRSVMTDLGSALPATLELAIFAALLAIALAVILGISSALASRGSGVFRFVMIAASSTPVFLFAIGGIYIFYGKLHWLPSSGQTGYPEAPTGPTKFLLIDSLLAGRAAVFWDAVRHLILPGLTLALLPAVSIGRVLRSSLVGVLDSDYVRTARSKGLSERAIVIRHAFRNALTAPLAMTGLQLGFMFAGVVIVEDVFAWPGIGQYAAQAIPVNDYPAVAGVTLIVGCMYILLNLTVDILQAVADPRIEL